MTADGFQRPVEQLRSADLFDEKWYRLQYPDVAVVGVEPAAHYLLVGAALLRDPGPGFSTRHYVESYPDVLNSGLNPLLHYIEHGKAEGRICRPAAIISWTVGKDEPMGLVNLPSTVLDSVGRYPGCRARVLGRPTVLVCAHVAGKHLFGGERSLLDIVEGFAALDFNVVVTVPAAGNDVYVDALRDGCMDVLNFRYGWWRKALPLDQGVVATFAAIIHAYGIDAVHANTIMLREPLVAARRMQIPAVVHVRELVMHDAALCKVIGLDPEEIIASVLENVDHVVANSHATGESFDKDGTSHFVPNTVDLDAFDVAVRTGVPLINIGLISSNIPKKGMFEFVEIARQVCTDVPNARFLLMGPETEHVQALRRQQEAGATPPNLELAGYQEHAVHGISQCDIVLNLSHFQESFGRTVLEAMAGSRPVIAYDWGALGELVVEGQTGFLVSFGDVAAVADRIRLLCRDRGRLRAMGRAGRAVAVRKYGKSHYAERLGTAYHAILAQAADHKLAAGPLVLPLRAARNYLGGRAALKIAYFLWHFPVPSETFVLNELRILVDQGHDVKVFCKQSPHAGFIPDFPIEWTRVDSPEMLARELIASGRTNVHSHFTFPTVTQMVWPACELAKIPFTFIAHAQDIFRYANDAQNRVGDISRSRMCSKVLVPSRFHRQYLVDRGVPERKLMINPNGVDPDLYRDGWSGLRARREWKSVCAIHRFTEKKGLEHLIRAGKLLAADGIDVHLYGYGDLEATFRQLIESQHLHNVHLHGPVEGREAMLDVFRQHDMFVCPSVRATDGDMDGIPTVLMEAMAAGLPVLTTGLSGIPDLVRHDTSGYTCDASPEAIAAAIRRFYALSDLQVEAVIEEGAALVRRGYNAAHLTAALVRLWQHESIDLLIVSWNNLTQLREVVRRIFAYTSSHFHLIICDNGSAGDVTAYLSELYAARDNVTIVFNRDNAFVGPGTNICMRHGMSRYAVYVCGKEGFILDYGWEKRIIDYMDQNPEVGLAGTLCHAPSYLVGKLYPKAIALFPKFRNTQFATDNPERHFAHVQGGFFAMRRQMFEDIGGFSDEVPHNYTDVEYSYYAESRGWKLGSAPGMLALYNKTRPGIFTRIDESVAAIHPPTLEDLPLLDDISRRSGNFCNLCNWQGTFILQGSLPLCGSCGSTPADRSLYRYLAESILTYRRLPALGVGIGAGLDAFWRQQFQGEPLSAGDACTRLASHRQFDMASAGRQFVYCDLQQIDAAATPAVLKELMRVLSPNGRLVLRGGGDASTAFFDGLDDFAEPGWEYEGTVRYSSSVSRYDWHPLWIYQRAKEQLCA